MRIAPIPEYMMYNGFERNLNADKVYERLMDSSESSTIISHALTFLHYCLIGKWIQNDSKPFLPQAQLFDMLSIDARRWAQVRFLQLLPGNYMGMTGQIGTAQARAKKTKL